MISILESKHHISEMGTQGFAWAIYAHASPSSSLTFHNFQNKPSLWSWGVASNNVELTNLCRSKNIPEFVVPINYYPIDLIFGFDPETDALILTFPIPLSWSINSWLRNIRYYSNDDPSKIIIGNVISPIILTMIKYRTPDIYSKALKKKKTSEILFWKNQYQELARMINQNIELSSFPF